MTIGKKKNSLFSIRINYLRTNITLLRIEVYEFSCNHIVRLKKNNDHKGCHIASIFQDYPPSTMYLHNI